MTRRAVRCGGDCVQAGGFDCSGVFFGGEAEVATEMEGCADVVEMERAVQCILRTGGAGLHPGICVERSYGEALDGSGREEAEGDGGGGWLLRAHADGNKACQQKESLHVDAWLHVAKKLRASWAASAPLPSGR